MSLKTFVSRTFAVQSCIMTAVAFAFVCNAVFGRYMFGVDISSTIMVGAICGALIAAGVGLMDFMTFHYGRVKDFCIFNLMSIVTANTIYNFNVELHMNAGWSIRGFILASLLGIVCGSAYAGACHAVKKLTVTQS
jgi:hypothetical protein